MPSLLKGRTHHKQGPLQPVGLSIAQEIAHHQNRQNQQPNHKDLKVEIHWLTKNPANEDDERAVEQRRLDGRGETMIKRNVDDAIWTS